MKFKEFGTIVDEPKKEFKEFGTIVEQPSETRSKLSAFPKGLIKGTASLASLRDPVGALLGLTDLSPHEQQALEKLLPTREEPFEKGLERAGKLVPAALGGGESLLAKGARVAGGAALGQLAEEAGLPEWAQGLAETSAFVSPKFGKRIIPRKSQQEAVEFLRSKGLTDTEITPLIRNENILNRILSKLSFKGKKLEKTSKDISSKLGEAYESLKIQGAEKTLKGNDLLRFDDKLSEELGKISPRFGRLIEKDLDALRNKGFSGKNLIDFYQDINAIVKSQEGGKAVLNKLKPIIFEGLEKIDPALANEYKGLNTYYAKNKKLIDSVKPGEIEKLFSGHKLLTAVSSLAALKFGFIPKLIGAHSAQLLIREFLTNPRLQNIGKQMAESAQTNMIPVAVRSAQHFINELKKKSPDLAKKLSNLQDQKNTSRLHKSDIEKEQQ